MAVALRRNASLIWWYLLQSLKVKMAYRANFFAELAGTVTYGVVNIGLLWVIFDRIGQELRGWSFSQVLLMYGIGELTFALFSVATIGIIFALPSYYILDGNLDRPLLRPAPLLLQLALEQLNLNDLTIVLKGVAIIVYALSVPGTVDEGAVGGILWWLACAATVIGGAIVYNGMFFTLACVSFWLKDRVSLTWTLFDFNEFSRYPLTIYPRAARIFFSWVLPFAFVAFYPATVMMGAREYWDMARWFPVVGIGLNAVGYGLWTRGLRSYESSGS